MKVGDLVHVLFDGRDHMGLIVWTDGYKATVLEAGGRLEVWDISDLKHMKFRVEEREALAKCYYRCVQT